VNECSNTHTATIMLETVISLPNDAKTDRVLGPLPRQGSGVE